jgi:hypothetical protein
MEIVFIQFLFRDHNISHNIYTLYILFLLKFAFKKLSIVNKLQVSSSREVS